ncbi:hypothetical protein [Longitalea luteola]|uniref:hypothetical protein n=1 Tax=Longitalea luteola TaxID=2812563 RepID=UPI001A9588EC|nr:hypothetical protein [Longitalea luteola]
MKRILFLIILFSLKKSLDAQTPYIYTIKADSVKITNTCDTAELIIENHTQNVPGFLFNKGRGRTEFRRATKLDDSTIVLGNDTIVIQGNIMANNGLSRAGKAVQLGQSVGASGNPAMLFDNREIPLNGNSLKFTGTAGNHLFDNSGNLSITGNGSFMDGRLYTEAKGFASDPGLHSTKSLWFLSDYNNPVFASLGNTSTSFTTLQLTTDAPNVPAMYSGVIMGFNYINTSDEIPKPLLITTSGYNSSRYRHAGDIIIKPGTVQSSQFQIHSLGDYSVILDPAGAGEVKVLKTLNAQASVRMNTVVSSATSLNLDANATIWVYSGSTSTTWILPSILPDNTNTTYFIKNRGGGAISLNGTIYSSSAVTNFTINPGEAFILSNDGTYWNIF